MFYRIVALIADERKNVYNKKLSKIHVIQPMRYKMIEYSIFEWRRSNMLIIGVCVNTSVLFVSSFSYYSLEYFNMQLFKLINFNEKLENLNPYEMNRKLFTFSNSRLHSAFNQLSTDYYTILRFISVRIEFRI